MATSKKPLQPSLFESGTPPEPFKKGVPLVMSSSMTATTLLQKKAMNALLRNAMSTEPVTKEGENPWWEIALVDIERAVDFDSNNRAYIRKALREIASIQFEYDVLRPSGPAYKVSVLFPELEVAQTTLRYQVSRTLQDEVLKPAQYAMLDMAVIRQFRRGASIHLYEMAKRYSNLDTTGAIPVSALRDILLGKTGQAKMYSDYKQFSSKVLRPSIAEVNAISDIEITDVVPTKIGLKITHLTFFIRMRNNPVTDAFTQVHADLLDQMKALGVSLSKAKTLLSKYGPEKVAQALELTKRRRENTAKQTLDRPDMYFRKALEGGWADDVEDVAIKPKREPKPVMGIKEQYLARQRAAMEERFNEYADEEKQGYIDRYNEQQGIPSLQIKTKRTTRLATESFFAWLVKETHGEPTADQLVAFADKMFANKR